MSETQKEFNLDSAKISSSELNGVSIQRLADRPNTPSAHGGAGLSSDELKRVFDSSAEILSKKHNLLIDEMVKLEGPNSAEAKRRLAEAKRQEYYEGLDKCLEMLEELQDKMIEAGANGSLVLKTALDVYPVGSIYISLNEESPANLFGGTWARIQDRFLLSAGDSYAAGSSGGNSTHNHSLTKAFANYSVAINGSHSYVERKAHDDNSNFGRYTPTHYLPPNLAQQYQEFTEGYSMNTATRLSGNTDSSDNMPPYLAVYMWKRVA